MTKLQKLLIEQSEGREKLNTLLDVEPDKLSDEQRGEMTTLTTRAVSIEPELRAALVAEKPTETTELNNDTEARELTALISKASVADIFAATIEHRQTSGETAELQKHFKLGANQIPLRMLETRAVTPAPANVQGNQQNIVPGVFPQSAANFLQIPISTVESGEAIFPVLATNATANVPAENAASTETTGSFSANKLSPSRIQASFFYSREDAARLGGMDEALRMNLSDALADGLDKQIISGTLGLLTGTNLANHAASALSDFGAYRSDLVYSRIDGIYASVASDLRILIGSETLAHMSTIYRGSNSDVSAFDSVMRAAMIRVSAHVPPVASKKQNALIRRGSRPDMAVAVWNNIVLIPDEITLADKGQIKISAIMLYAVKILRSGGFYKQESQIAA